MFDNDPEGTSSTIILSFSGKGFSCGCGLEKVNILEARKMINKQNCATKTLEGWCAGGLGNKAWLGGDDVVT